MSRPLLLIGTAGLHHDQRWLALCSELGLATHFHGIGGKSVRSLTGLSAPNPYSGGSQKLAELALAERLQLRQLIEDLDPFAVHALGSHPAGILAYDALSISVRPLPPLIVHIRGGAELELYRHSPAHAAKLREVFSACAVVIGDNSRSYDHARSFGFADPLGIGFSVLLPGNCGEIELGGVRSSKTPATKPSILWPKAYSNPNVDPYPIIEAVARSWEKGLDFKLISFGMEMPELLYWAQGRFPPARLADFEPHTPVDRTCFLNYLRDSDILLSPSLFDGISNVLLEAMAYGCMPIVSRHDALPDDLVALETIEFAHNLRVDEIVAAIGNLLALDVEERKRRASINATWAEQHCSRPKILDQAAHLYHVLGGPTVLSTRRPQ